MKIMENVRIELYLGEGATGAQCTISSAGSGVGSVGGIEGSWTFDPRRPVRIIVSRSGRTCRSSIQVLCWEIPNMHSSGSWVLRGSWTSKYVRSAVVARCVFDCLFRTKIPRPAHAFQIYFEIPSYSFSSLKVDQVRLSGETYKMYKGVRTVGRGSIEWRW